MTRDHVRRRRIVLALAGATVLVSSVVPATSSTEAAFTDVEHANATLTAYVVPRPSLFGSCTTNPGLLGATPSITIDYALPAGFTTTALQYGVGGSPTSITRVTSGVTTTTVSTNRYRTVFTGGLLSGLLGGSATVAVRVLDVPHNDWTSRWATATGGSGLAGIGAYCTVNP